MENNRNIPGLTIRQFLFVLITSWLFTLFTYYMPMPFIDNIYSICEIYTFEGIPFTLILGVILYYLKK